MAQFAELTLASGRRVLVNPDTVANFAEHDAGPSVRDYRTSVLLTASPHPMRVKEEPAEVLRRLCAPAMPDLDDDADGPAVAQILRVFASLPHWREFDDPSGLLTRVAAIVGAE